MEILAEKKRLAALQASTVATQVVEQEEIQLVPEPVIKTNLVEAISDSKLIEEDIGKINETILRDAELTTADIVPRIRQLASLSDADIEGEMSLLKAALMANPQAVSLMLPEDVGLLVVSLRRITKESILAEAEKKATKSKPKASKIDITKMSKEDILDITDF